MLSGFPCVHYLWTFPTGSAVGAGKLLLLHFTHEETGPQRGSDWPKVTQLGSDRTRPGTQMCLVPKPTLLTMTSPCFTETMTTSNTYWAKCCTEWASDIITSFATFSILLRQIVIPFSRREKWGCLGKWWSQDLNLGYSSSPVYSMKDVDTECHETSGTK